MAQDLPSLLVPLVSLERPHPHPSRGSPHSSPDSLPLGVPPQPSHDIPHPSPPVLPPLPHIPLPRSPPPEKDVPLPPLVQIQVQGPGAAAPVWAPVQVHAVQAAPWPLASQAPPQACWGQSQPPPAPPAPSLPPQLAGAAPAAPPAATGRLTPRAMRLQRDWPGELPTSLIQPKGGGVFAHGTPSPMNPMEGQPEALS